MDKKKEPDVADNSKETASSRHNRTNTHMNSQRLLHCELDMHIFKPEKIHSINKDRQTQCPIPHQEAICHWHLPGNQKTFFSNGVSLCI